MITETFNTAKCTHDDKLDQHVTWNIFLLSGRTIRKENELSE